jgi:hypothetical protein
MHWDTVTPLLQDVLRHTMSSEVFDPFRLVGGTSLSLQMGHRESIDIDLFTDAPYDSIDFEAIDKFFRNHYPYVQTNAGLPVAFGSSWFVGESEEDFVKVDLYYTDPYIRSIVEEEKIRMASKEDIIAMKLEVLGNGGRKKDFWDLHGLHDEYSIQDMIDLHQERFPFSHTPDDLGKAFTNFEEADDDLDPVCLLGKQWQLIKLDLTQWVEAE